MNTDRFIDSDWNMFLALEGDLINVSRFIEFHEKNFHVFSIELQRLLVTTCAEFEVAIKSLALLVDSKVKLENIHDYGNFLMRYFPDIVKIKISLKRFGVTIDSFFGKFETNESPDWWKAYNGIKHEGHVKYENANLNNVLDAMGALFIVLLLLKREQKVRIPIRIHWVLAQVPAPPQIFDLDNYGMDIVKKFNFHEK